MAGCVECHCECGPSYSNLVKQVLFFFPIFSDENTNPERFKNLPKTNFLKRQSWLQKKC
jgi:hypothetical protein